MSPNALHAAHTASHNASAVDLPRRAMLKLPDAAAVDIECRSGSLWITLDEDPRDFIVEAGERFSTNAHTPAIVYALHAAVVLVHPQRPAAPSSAAASGRPRAARPSGPRWAGLQQPVPVR
jgi:hypothetical protein